MRLLECRGGERGGQCFKRGERGLRIGRRGVGVDADGVAWAAFSSGQIGRFDRRKCKLLNGLTAPGQQCPEGWSFCDLPSPKVGNGGATSDFVYLAN